MTGTLVGNDVQSLPFLVKVLTTFTKMNAQDKEVKFKEEVIFKLDAPSARMPWYVLRNYLVPKFLVDKYGPHEVGWQKIYEIKILKLINRKNPSDITDIPLRVMTMNQLEQYVAKWEFNVPVTEFYSVEKAREMVALRQEDEKGYQTHLKEYREGKQRSYPELDGMRGDAKAAIADVTEFEALEAKVPTVVEKKKPEGGEAAGNLSSEEEKLLNDQGNGLAPSTGDQGLAKDPFAQI